jgi:branched-chain amino acid transport system ATP-binding protein
VRHNLLTAQHLHARYGALGGLVASPRSTEREQAMQDRAAHTLDLLDLAAIVDTVVDDLPYGMLKRVEVAAALASGPDVLLLDEPASGLNTAETEAFAEVLLEVRDRFKLTILLVEHDMGLVMNISDTITVLNFGRKIAEGTPRDVQSNPDVIKAYLGESAGVDAR